MLFTETHKMNELEKLRQIWLTSEDEDDAFAFADACGNALPELLAKMKRLEEALQAIVNNAEIDTDAVLFRAQAAGHARAALKETGQ
jgi:hypothetical protein